MSTLGLTILKTDWARRAAQAGVALGATILVAEAITAVAKAVSAVSDAVETVQKRKKT